jgi:hypothetical protein
MGEDYNRIAGEEAQQFHRLWLPRKLEKLRADFGVASDLEPHVLTINRVRNCLVHRLGIVMDQDVDANGELVALWRSPTIVKQNSDGTQEMSLEEPDEIIEPGWSVIVRVVDQRKRFQRGERVELSYRELTHTFSTLMAFTTSLAQSIEEYGKQVGMRMPELNPEDV